MRSIALHQKLNNQGDYSRDNKEYVNRSITELHNFKLKSDSLKNKNNLHIKEDKDIDM